MHSLVHGGMPVVWWVAAALLRWKYKKAGGGMVQEGRGSRLPMLYIVQGRGLPVPVPGRNFHSWEDASWIEVSPPQHRIILNHSINDSPK